ncbi:hypothetical protein [Paludisphaera mucosa]|uniref:Secreted protein n=1 Tax=Paludisphaera mucosa TaxID=3030827 RepID=A0ABT6FH04_9BACT|nr:hypothetical protein [Paludisphaera mucosa]MDG3006863.1 hypothetical protein [Paludisphaera mucosa]
MSRLNLLTLSALALCTIILFAGCGEEQRTVFKDANELPPINADAAAAARSEDEAVADAERSEGAKTQPASSRKR